uniref:Uncharacterized protein n=1 Tax=Candidatus Kentrum sp. TUN TaxID=2126343 RepID=A0A451A8L4_9GAMM|nr:MAG: hypothetical protein BECKTUN1418F_GA0071002_13013 [Candidatus Kentron sp. TUN]
MTEQQAQVCQEGMKSCFHKYSDCELHSLSGSQLSTALLLLVTTISIGFGVCQQSCPVMFTIIYKLFVP